MIYLDRVIRRWAQGILCQCDPKHTPSRLEYWTECCKSKGTPMMKEDDGPYVYPWQGGAGRQAWAGRVRRAGERGAAQSFVVRAMFRARSMPAGVRKSFKKEEGGMRDGGSKPRMAMHMKFAIRGALAGGTASGSSC